MKAFLLAGIVLCGTSFGWTTTATAADASVPTSTRKVVLEKTESGRYGWKLKSGPVPTPGEHQVLVHVRAVALNRGDIENFDAESGPYPPDMLVASDAAGDVVAVGPKVTGVRKGDKVTSTYFRAWADGTMKPEYLKAALGASVDGVLADYIVLQDAGVVRIPNGLTYEEASTLPTAGLTAYMATIGYRDLKKGDVVLVQGTGGVSTFAAQFAAAAGARVIVTSSSDEKIAKAKSYGAQDGINYKATPAWSTRVMEITSGHGADLVVDVGGKDTLTESAKSVAFGGQVSIVGGLTGYGGMLPARTLIGRAARAQGIYVGSQADFVRMNAFITRHHLRPVIERVVPFDQYADALRQLESGSFVGKLVLRL